MNSVCLLTVDCLRRDHVGYYGYDRSTTPNIDSLAEQGTAFEGYANCPGTRWAFQTLHTGVLTTRIDGFGIPQDYEPLAEKFQQFGYSTAGFVDNGWVSRDYGYNKGFDKFYSVEDTTAEAPLIKRIGVRASNLVGDSITDRLLTPIHDRWMKNQRTDEGFKPPHTDGDTVDEALNWLNSQSEPYFLWVHFMDAHTPYGYWPEHLEAVRGDTDIEHTIHPGKDALVTKGQPPSQRVIDTYDAGIRYVDKQIGRMINHFEDDTTVVITGDHGEEFGTYNDFHHASLYHTMTDVPLVVQDDDIDSDRDGEVAQHIDIPGTLLVAGGGDPPSHWDGVPLQVESRSTTDPIFFALHKGQRAVQRDSWKLIQENEKSKLLERVDRGEVERPFNEGPGPELKTKLELFWEETRSIGEAHKTADMRRITEENLENLGYL